jgi:hypothetical protein
MQTGAQVGTNPHPVVGTKSEAEAVVDAVPTATMGSQAYERTWPAGPHEGVPVQDEVLSQVGKGGGHMEVTTLVLAATVVVGSVETEPEPTFELLETPAAALPLADPAEEKVGGKTHAISGQAPEEQVPEVTDSQLLQQVGQEEEAVKLQGLQVARERTVVSGGGAGAQPPPSTAISGQRVEQAAVFLTQNPVEPGQPQHCCSPGQEEALQVSQATGHETTHAAPRGIQKATEGH